MKWLLLVFFIGLANTQIVKDGKCPDMHVMTDFDKTKMLGKWYLYKSYEYDDIKDLICVSSDYETWDDEELKGHSHAINTTTSEKENIPFTAKFIDDHHTAKFTSKYTLRGVLETSDFQIVDTDYENYQIGWECDEEDGKSETYVWIETRKKTMTQEMLDKVMEFMKKHDIDTTELKDMEQEKC